MEDQRIFERLDTRVPLRFLDPASGKEGIAETVDISANGLGMITKEGLNTSTALEMWLAIPDHRDPFYTRGEVVWSKASAGTSQNRVGIRLEKAELMGLARTLWLKERA
ncbi:MAG: PilZ domain-containing protein [Candidatus Omnitrophota bacterium]